MRSRDETDVAHRGLRVEQSQLEMLANGFAAAALGALAASILVPLARRGHLRRNRMDLGAALVFLSCGLGHLIRLALGLAGGTGTGATWLVASGDEVTAAIALTYVWLRRAGASPEEGGVLHEDVRRRQHELAGQVMAANVREELATERASAADQRLARVLASAPVGMAVVDPGGHITRANPALSRFVRRDDAPEAHEELAGVRLAELFAPDDGPGVAALLAGAADGVDGMELRITRTDGRSAWARLTATPLTGDDGAVLVHVEETTERHEAEERLEQLATHDPLTGLPNSHLLHTRAAAAVRQANRTGCYVGCLFVDLDHFRMVNDSLGHVAGDRVLTTVAARLIEAVRPEDTVARVGDDEFCLLLLGLEHQAECEIVAERVRRTLGGTLDLDGVHVTMSASVGVAVARPGDKATAETLVRDADTALCQAKASGLSRIVVYDPELREDALRQLRQEHEHAAST